ncbi:hypothetical protein BS47DRAFT_798233 [Hydnum rufescens UP504]|uniref:Uncharacterized protein n=1 Tax=Hydnum rufescens UP504 TaxID=1448309 RepID=A0A9P6B039_9AGAM|nr:hypothetical protein BS47DRAFT_798233 [Hydnum rufescens UP504]
MTAILSEDLQNALRNVGSRVRHNVSTGYTTSRLTTPNASPIKPPAPQSSPMYYPDAPIPPPRFMTATDTLIDIFTVLPSSDTAQPSLTSRVNKRSRGEVATMAPDFWDDDENDAMDMDMDRNSDTEGMEFPPIITSRLIKPLRRQRTRPTSTGDPTASSAISVEENRGGGDRTTDIAAISKHQPE